MTEKTQKIIEPLKESIKDNPQRRNENGDNKRVTEVHIPRQPPPEPPPRPKR